MTQITPISVRCHHCGAPLAVSEAARFITCSYCGTELAIKREGGAVYTELLQDVHLKTQQIARDVESIKRQNALEQLDREWSMRSQQLMVRSKDGSTSAPSPAGAMIGAGVAVVAGILWMIGAAAAGAPPIFPLFGLLFIGVAIVGVVSTLSKSQSYAHEEAEYQRKRQELLREIQKPGH